MTIDENDPSMLLQARRQETATRSTRSGWAHDCALCGAGACFGFTDRRGVTRWTCPEHRDRGRIALTR